MWIKTEAVAYLNILGRRGFALERRRSEMHYLHRVQLPSHCGLGKQYKSPNSAPSTKKKKKKKTSTQISLSLASYKDLSMNESLCESKELTPTVPASLAP